MADGFDPTRPGGSGPGVPGGNLPPVPSQAGIFQPAGPTGQPYLPQGSGQQPQGGLGPQQSYQQSGNQGTPQPPATQPPNQPQPNSERKTLWRVGITIAVLLVVAGLFFLFTNLLEGDPSPGTSPTPKSSTQPSGSVPQASDPNASQSAQPSITASTPVPITSQSVPATTEPTSTKEPMPEKVGDWTATTRDELRSTYTKGDQTIATMVWPSISIDNLKSGLEKTKDYGKSVCGVTVTQEIPTCLTPTSNAVIQTSGHLDPQVLVDFTNALLSVWDY